MQSQLQIHRENDREAGYVLIGVIFLTVILLVSLAVAAPKIAMSIQRDKELETIHRGQQYRRAIKLYYQKFGTYPTSIDQLVETNQIRFLRKRYTDPMTGKADWKPVFFGQAHVRPLGFFGQPLMTAGVGMTSSSMYAVAATTTTDANGVPVASGDQSGSGATGGSSSGTGFGSSGSSFGSSGSSFGSSGSSFGSSGSSFGSSGSSFGSSGSSFGQQSGSSFGQPSSSSPGSGLSGSSFGSSGGTSATTFGGGGPIVGFTLPVDKPSLIDYMLQTRYNKWEFNYDPAAEQAQAMAGLAGGGTPPNGSGSPGMPGTPGNGPGQTTPGQIPTPPPGSSSPQ